MTEKVKSTFFSSSKLAFASNTQTRMIVSFVLLLLLAFAPAVSAAVQPFFFANRVDHFNPQDSRTYQQQWFINDTTYQPGGPVFFQLGGEGPLDGTEVTSLQMSVYAKQYR